MVMMSISPESDNPKIDHASLASERSWFIHALLGLEETGLTDWQRTQAALVEMLQELEQGQALNKSIRAAVNQVATAIERQLTT